MSETKVNPNVIHPELSYRIVGILFEIHNTLGRYCQEKQYGDALETMLKEANIPYIREYQIEHALSAISPIRNKVDFVIDKKIIIELKAKHNITRDDYFQAQRYLKSTDLELALLVNFRYPHVAVKRILNARQ